MAKLSKEARSRLVTTLNSQEIGNEVSNAIDSGSNSSIATTAAITNIVNQKVNSFSLNKTNVGLGNVDNTSDADKPISDATQAALDNISSDTTSAINTVANDLANAVSDISGLTSDVSDINNELPLKAPLESPAFTGTVTGITKSMVGLGNVDNTSDNNKPVSAAQAAADSAILGSAQLYTDGKIADLINSAPSTLDTLQELADALGDDPNFAATVTASIGTKKTDSMSTNKILGRSTAGTGVIEEITVGSGLSLSAGTLSASGGGGANTDLSNLTSTAINTDLVFADSATNSVQNTRIISTGAATVAGDLNGSDHLTIQSGSTPFGSTGNVTIKTSNATNNNWGFGTVVSGSIELQTGTASNGPRGKIKLKDGSEGTVGHIWTQTNADGSGAWQAPSGGGSTLISTAYLANAHTVNTNFYTKVLLDTASRDLSSIFDAPNSRWVIPAVSGTVDVEISAKARMSANGATGEFMVLSIYKNAVLVEEGVPFTTATSGGSAASALWNGTAVTGDVFEIKVYFNYSQDYMLTALPGYTEGTLKIFNQ